MFCSECGCEYQPNAKFCKSCGLSLVEFVKTTKDVPLQQPESLKTNSVDFGGALSTSTPTLSSSKSHPTTNPALWNPNAAASWSLPLSAAFGAYLQMLNWRALGEHEKARQSQIWFYVILFLPIPLILFAADAGNLAFALDVIPTGLPFPIVIAWYFLSGKAQSKYVKEKFGDNYPRQPWGKTLLIGFGVVIAYWALIVTLFGLWGASGAFGIQKTVAQTAATFDSATVRPADNATNWDKGVITVPADRPDEIDKFLADAPQQEN